VYKIYYSEVWTYDMAHSILACRSDLGICPLHPRQIWKK